LCSSLSLPMASLRPWNTKLADITVKSYSIHRQMRTYEMISQWQYCVFDVLRMKILPPKDETFAGISSRIPDQLSLLKRDVMWRSSAHGSENIRLMECLTAGFDVHLVGAAAVVMKAVNESSAPARHLVSTFISHSCIYCQWWYQLH
jgi:hypothetical protein